MALKWLIWACCVIVSTTLPARAGVMLSAYAATPGQQPLPTIWTNDPLPDFYRLRAKIIDGTTFGFQAASAMNNNHAPLDSLDNLLPGFYSIALYIVGYTDESGTTPNYVGPETDLGFTVTSTNVWLTSEQATSIALPNIRSNEAMPAVYKLRAKVINVPGYSDGFHAALSWNNKNHVLDACPPVGSWSTQLYWIKYDSTGSYIQTIGPFFDRNILVPSGSIYLSSNFFDAAHPPAIITTQPMPSNYRLRAVFSYGGPAAFLATTTANNNGYLLDRLPAPSTYPMDLYWEYLDTAGNVTSTGPHTHISQVTVYDGSTTFNLNQAGTIRAVQNFDEDNNPTDISYEGQDFSFYVPTSGVLTINLTGVASGLGCQVYDVNGAQVPLALNSGVRTATVTSIGRYHVYVYGDGAGTFNIVANLSPWAPATSAPLAMGAKDVTSTSFTATWSAAAAATGYLLDISGNNYFNDFVLHDQPVGSTMTQFALNNLPPATTYFYRVRAINSASTSAYSATAEVTTAPPPPTAQTQELVGSGFTTTWDLVAGAAQYEVLVSNNASFSDARSFVYSNSPNAVLPIGFWWGQQLGYYSFSTSGNTITFTTTGLVGETAYYYQVYAYGTFGAKSGTAVIPFTTPAPRPIQLALQYWEAGDQPNLWVGYYVDVWEENSTDDDGNDYYDPHWETQWIQTYYPDGAAGSSWSTTLGRFHRDDPVSGYNQTTLNRVYLLNNYEIGQYVTVRFWGVVPDYNCSTITGAIYAPGGSSPVYSSTFAPGITNSWEKSFGTFGGAGNTYRFDVGYTGATQASPASGVVSYYLPVGVLPVLVSQPGPASQTAYAGTSITYSVVASGSPTYQWQKGGVAISGATYATLTLNNVQAADAGSYTVVVSNSHGSVTSSTATLTIGSGTASPPSITRQPANGTFTVGQNAAFSVVATGSPPLSYQWKKDGNAIAGATSANLFLGNLQTGNAGTYSVVVTNAAGSVTSANATLIVGTSDTSNQTQLKLHTPLP